MDSTLAKLNDVLKETILELKTHHEDELKAQLEPHQDAAAILPSQPHLAESVRLLHELQLTLTPAVTLAVDGIFAFITSKALLAATEYKIPELLETHGALSAAEISSRASPPLDAAQVTGLLHLLSSHGIFAFDPASGKFANSGASRLVSSTHWAQWRRWVTVYPGRFYDIFSHQAAALPTSEPRTALQLAHGGGDAALSTYAIFRSLPWVGDLQAMLAAGAVAQAPGMLRDYPWEELAAGGREGAICDLGGGNGTFLAELLRANPEMYGAVLELEGATAEAARRNLLESDGAHADVAARVLAVHPGDFFETVPPYANYVSRWTLHNWNDEKAAAILRKAREALVVRDGSRFLVVESVVEEGERGGGPLARPALYGSLTMAVGSKGALERTKAQWTALCESAGWRVHAVHRLRHCVPSVIDLRPV